MQLRLAGTFRDSQRAGCLRVAIPIDTDEHQHVPSAFGQCSDGTLDIERRRPAARIRPVGQPEGGFRDLVLEP